MYLSIALLLLGLFPELGEACLNCVDVHVDHVLRFLGRLILGRFLGFVVLLLDEPQLFIDLIEGTTDLDFGNLGNGRLDNSHQQRMEEVEKSLVIRLLEVDLQILERDSDIFDLEDTIAVLLVGGGQFQVERQSLSAEEDVHNTSVLETGETLFLLDVVGDIFQITLNLRHVDGETVNVSAAESLATPSEEVVGLDFENVGQQVLGFEDKVLNNNIDHRVAGLNTRNLKLARLRKRHTGTYRMFSKNPGMITSVTSVRRCFLNLTLPFLS